MSLNIPEDADWCGSCGLSKEKGLESIDCTGKRHLLTMSWVTRSLVTTSLVITNTCLQRVQLQRSPAYNEFSYKEQLLTMSSVTKSICLQ